MNDIRKELARLIQVGLNGRSLRDLFFATRNLFERHSEKLSEACFYSWVEGLSFPANLHRQLLLAEAVGGANGDRIRKLRGPAFRGYRRRVMREKETEMAHGGVSGGIHGQRIFPHIGFKGEDGRTHQRPLIICAECGARETCVRHGTEECEDKFRKKGWEVGNNAAHDYCPKCAAAKRKVVKMSDHKKPDPAPELELSKDDRRLIIKAIEPHWDDTLNMYKPGWSDQKIAEDMGTRLAWVKQVREDIYGGVGEDPGITAFVAEQKGMEDEVKALAALLAELEGQTNKTKALAAGYKEKHQNLAARVHKLGEVARSLSPFRNAS